MYLDKLVGQSRAKAILEPALEQGNLPQALIFAGPPGVGRRTAARLVAEAIHGSADINHPDTVWFSRIIEEKRAQKNTAPIKSAADEVVKYLTMSPIASKSKVVVIENAEELTDDAQNGLLKTLEEPKADSLLILIVEDERILLPTILSRAQVVRFVPLSDEEIQRIVPGATVELLNVSAGSAGVTRELLEDPERLTRLTEMIKFWEGVHTLDTETKFAWSEKFKSREEAAQFVKTGMQVWSRALKDNPTVEGAKVLDHLDEAYLFLLSNGHIRTVLDNLFLMFQ